MGEQDHVNPNEYGHSAVCWYGLGLAYARVLLTTEPLAYRFTPQRRTRGVRRQMDTDKGIGVQFCKVNICKKYL